MDTEKEMVPLYDNFSAQYDYFVDWSQRLAFEMPFIEDQLNSVHARSVLDAACGTGMHAIALAGKDYQLTATDASPGMIDQAKVNVLSSGHNVQLAVAGFGQLASTIGEQFDALLCLGNSLPHAITREALDAALQDFAATLHPGGLLLIQNRNFDAVMAGRDRWMPPEQRIDGQHQYLFLRFYDFNPDGTLTFNVLSLHRDGQEEAWIQQADSTPLRPWLQAELVDALNVQGFGNVKCYGDMSGSPFDARSSGNLVIAARLNLP